MFWTNVGIWLVILFVVLWALYRVRYWLMKDLIDDDRPWRRTSRDEQVDHGQGDDEGTNREGWQGRGPIN
ncbi:MAG TPA: hypothetical protein VGM93_02460 [Acidimicrobiales bacterium]